MQALISQECKCKRPNEWASDAGPPCFIDGWEPTDTWDVVVAARSWCYYPECCRWYAVRHSATLWASIQAIWYGRWGFEYLNCISGYSHGNSVSIDKCFVIFDRTDKKTYLGVWSTPETTIILPVIQPVIQPAHNGSTYRQCFVVITVKRLIEMELRNILYIKMTLRSMKALGGPYIFLFMK